MVASSGDTVYYVDDYSDEIMPAGPTLQSWADFLADPTGGDSGWEHEVPADGTMFAVSALRFAEDVIASRDASGEWSFSREVPDDASLVAVRFGPGLGWDAENIVCPEPARNHHEAMIDFLDDELNNAGDQELIAIGFSEPSMMAVFHRSPPRLEIVGTRQ